MQKNAGEEYLVALVSAIAADAMLFRNDFPEFSANLVSTLAGLEMHNFPHALN